MMDPMMEALQKRRGKGLEISILMQPEKETVEEEKNSDLAPKKKMEAEMESEPEMEMMEGEEEMDEALMDGVSDYDKEEMMKSDKPKSLGERVRMEALKRKLK